MNEHVVHMATMGLLVSVVAPALTIGLCRFPALDRLALPGVVVLPGFTLLHGAITIMGDSPGAMAGPLTGTAGHVALLLGAVLFWAPVLGTRRRLPDAGRAVYLFLAGPLLDLAGVWLVAQGDAAGGLAMIVGMLPIGVAAIVVTWRWISREERQARSAA
jgi:cytochrome c oxidase assembly factor CtaG